MTVLENKISLQAGDALIIVDLQNDFLPGGSLAVPEGDQVIAPLNKVIFFFNEKRLPIFATREWHPANHISFSNQGGALPTHCVQRTKGASFATRLDLPCYAQIISKGVNREQDNTSGFEDTGLDLQIRSLQINRLFIGGFAQESSVKNTALDGCKLGYDIYLLRDGTAGYKEEDGEKALKTMAEAGAAIIRTSQLTL